jgi:ABC-type transport system substrate-binding protein
MTSNPRGFWFRIIIVGVAAFMMACGGDDNGGSGDPLNPNGSGSNPGAGVDADLRLVGGDPITLDPALAGDEGSASYIVELFGGLVTIDRNLAIVPDLAEAMPQVVTNADGTQTYTFKIRRDAQFHDGRPVTAEDVSYSLNRTARLGGARDLKAGETPSATAEAYLGDIVGVRDYIRGRRDDIPGIKVVDSSTISITIDAPKAYFLAKLTYPTAFVVDKQQVEANSRNWTRKPNGTGPFKMVEWRLNERIVLEANKRYHLGAPQVNRVLFLLAGGSVLTQYENNELDVAGISTLDIERVQSPRDPLNTEYKTGPQLSIGYIGFNVKTPPFDDPKVRQAFAMSIDREQIARVVLKNMAPVANSIMMPGLPGYNQQAQTLAFDPARAKQLLAESKYGSAAGLGTVTITEIGGGANAGVATQAILEMWRNNLGVEVSIAQTEAASFFEDLDRGRLQMFDIGWIMDYPDPEDIIDLLFHSSSRQNTTGYANPHVDALVVQARTEQDQTKRLQLYQQAEQLIIQDAPWIPLFFGKDHYVVKPNVKGYDPIPIVVPRLRYITVN